ncbi:hypothetical protein TWF694_010089 [Orbilia ellipsospora]|uniref:Uncharacterized protein n=1 Tax=Orbilia ellipsospora TaxID=2528407 RepID=A0AAV9XBY2_9PEZI
MMFQSFILAVILAWASLASGAYLPSRQNETAPASNSTRVGPWKMTVVARDPVKRNVNVRRGFRFFGWGGSNAASTSAQKSTFPQLKLRGRDTGINGTSILLALNSTIVESAMNGTALGTK